MNASSWRERERERERGREGERERKVGREGGENVNHVTITDEHVISIDKSCDILFLLYDGTKLCI